MKATFVAALAVIGVAAFFSGCAGMFDGNLAMIEKCPYFWQSISGWSDDKYQDKATCNLRQVYHYTQGEDREVWEYVYFTGCLSEVRCKVVEEPKGQAAVWFREGAGEPVVYYFADGEMVSKPRDNATVPDGWVALSRVEV